MDINELKMTSKEQTEVLNNITNQLDSMDRNTFAHMIIDLLTTSQKRQILEKCAIHFKAETMVSLTENDIITEEGEVML